MACHSNSAVKMKRGKREIALKAMIHPIKCISAARTEARRIETYATRKKGHFGLSLMKELRKSILVKVN